MEIEQNIAKEIKSILERHNFSYEQESDIRDICSALISYIDESNNK